LLASTAGYSQSQVTFNRTYDRELLINTNEGGLIENSLGYLTGNAIGRPNSFVKWWLMQIDFNGDTIWNKTYGDSATLDFYASIRGLVFSRDSGFYYMGAGIGSYSTFMSYGTLAKLTLSGDTLWTSRVKFAPRNTTCWQMIKSSKEELVFVGNNYDFHPTWQYVNIGACAYAFDTSGNLLWNQTYTHGIGNQFLFQLVETPDKGFIMCGRSYFGPSGNNSDFWVIRTDSVGNVIWENFYGGTGTQRGYGIMKLSDGNYLLFGSSGNPGHIRGRIYKIDINGTVIWQRTYNSQLVNQNESIWRMIELSSGDIICIGVSTNNPTGYEGGWIMKIGPQGAKKWERYFYYLGGDSDIDNFNTGIPTSDGGILLAGFASPGAGVFNPPFLSPSDVWLVKLDSLGCDSAGCPTVFTGIEPNPYVSVTNILAYPNPFSSQPVILNVPGVKPNEGVGFQITDVLGKTLRTGTLKATAMDYVIISEQETQHLSQGIYFIQLKTKNGVFGAKVVKQ
jgi:hypothetical protein